MQRKSEISDPHHHHIINHRVTRYVYHVVGHILVAPADPAEETFNAPFDTIVRAETPVTSSSEYGAFLHDLRPVIESELANAMPGAGLKADPMIRSLTLLHVIKVNSDDLNGYPTNILGVW